MSEADPESAVGRVVEGAGGVGMVALTWGAVLTVFCTGAVVVVTVWGAVVFTVSTTCLVGPLAVVVTPGVGVPAAERAKLEICWLAPVMLPTWLAMLAWSRSCNVARRACAARSILLS